MGLRPGESIPEGEKEKKTFCPVEGVWMFFPEQLPPFESFLGYTRKNLFTGQVFMDILYLWRAYND